MVQVNGTALPGPTRFSALFASTSWKAIPANSGVRTVRTTFDSRASAGSASSASARSA